MRAAALANTYLFDAMGRLAAASRAAGAPADLGAFIGRETADQILADRSRLRSGGEWEVSLRLAGEGLPPGVKLRLLAGPAGSFIVATVGELPATSGIGCDAASRDAVTDLPDRRAIAAWGAARQPDRSTAVRPFAALFIDLDHFKQVNDRHSHAAGDAVLAELAARWSAAVRDRDLVIRYGGDEFVILLDSVADRAAAEPIVRRLTKATQQPIDWLGAQIEVAATIGVAVSDGSAMSMEGLIAAADEDMYAQKRAQAK